MPASLGARRGRSTLRGRMSPFWIWTQALIVIFTVAAMVIAITKLV